MFTISGNSGTLPDGLTLMRGTWSVSIFSSNGTRFEGSGTGWSGGHQAYETAEADATLTLNLPATDGTFYYEATFTSNDRTFKLGPFRFDLTANRTWRSIIDAPTVTPVPLLAADILDAINDRLAALEASTGAVAATPTVAGITKYATNAQTITGTATDLATVPAGVKAALNAQTHTASQITDFGAALRAAVNAMILEGANVTKVYDGTAGTLTISSSGSGGGVDMETVRDNLATALVDSPGIDIAVSDPADTFTFTISGLTIAQTTGLQTALNDLADTITDGLATKIDTIDLSNVSAGYVHGVVYNLTTWPGTGWPATRPSSRADIYMQVWGTTVANAPTWMLTSDLSHLDAV